MNAKSRKRNKNSERKAYYVMLHREYDTKSIVQSVKDTIEIALGNDGLAMMTGTVY